MSVEYNEGQFPKLVLLAATSPCNAKCPHCPATITDAIRNTEDAFIKPEYFKKIVDECEKHNSHLRISGYGEPLLHPNILDLIDYARSKMVKTSIITNGSLLNERKINRLLGAEIDSIEISVDSHKKEIYEKIRVGLNFNKVKKNIINLVETRNRLRKGTVIMASIINQPSKNPDIKGAKEFWKKIVDNVMIRKYVTWGVLPQDDCLKINQVERTPCPYPFERLMIDPGGCIRLCPYDDQKLVPAFGHLSKDTIESAWKSSRMEKIRRCHIFSDFANAELCDRCTDYLYRSWTHNYFKALKNARKRRKT